MSMQGIEKRPAAAGSNRVEQERAQRRRRSDLDVGRHRTLTLPPELEDDRYVHRWINDEPGRVQRLTVMDDWDVVSLNGHTSDKDKQVGTTVERVVDKMSGKRAILVRKLKEYYLEDKAKEQRHLDTMDEQLKRGTVSAQSPEAEDLSGSSYVPSGGIVIKDGRRS